MTFHSLQKNRAFKRVYRVGKAAGGQLATLVYAKSREPFTRCGFSVSKKVGKAVARNRAKRRMREAFRQLPVKSGFHVVFVAKKEITQASFSEIKQGLEKLLARASLLL